MASITSPESTAASRPARAMTRCECTELPFDAIIRYMSENGLNLDEVSRKTGCGRLCTACLPDLKARAARGD